MTGLLFAPRDVEGLAAAICTLAESPTLRRRLGCAAAAETHRRWPYDAIVDQMATVYAVASSTQA